MKPFINYYPQLKQSIKKFKLFIYQGMKNAMQTLNHSITQYIVFLKKWLYPFLSFILFIRLGPNLLQCRNIRYQTCVSKQYNQYSAENKWAKIFYDTKMQHRCSLVLLGLFTVQLRFKYFRRLALKTITKQSNTTYACMQLCIMDVQFG